MEFEVVCNNCYFDGKPYYLSTEAYNELVLFIIDTLSWIRKKNNLGYEVDTAMVYALFSAMIEVKHPKTKNEVIMVVLDVIKKIAVVNGDFNEHFEEVIFENAKRIF